MLFLAKSASAAEADGLGAEVSVTGAVDSVTSVDGSDNALGEPEGKPRFEFGVAAAALEVPAYPASAVKSKRQFVVPWFIYRSDNVQVKDGGISMVAYESERLKIDLGISGSLNADTSETPLREGMPDIDYLFEFGPRFNVPLSDTTTDGIRTRFNWVTSLRVALSTDFGGIDYRGPVLNTELAYRGSGFYNDKLSFNASVFSTWIGNELMDYFYSVGNEFATADRPEFNAEGGFLNVGLSAGLGFEPTPDIATFIGLGYASYHGSRNEDSPLFEDDANARIIVAASWRLYQSKRLVFVSDE